MEGYKPTLGQILEESNTSDGSVSESLLDEYAVLSEHDLLIALDLHSDCEECEGTNNLDGQSKDVSEKINGDSSFDDFHALHNNIKVKNKGVLEKYKVKPNIDRQTNNNTSPEKTPVSVSRSSTSSLTSDTSSYVSTVSCTHKEWYNDATSSIPLDSNIGKKIFMRAVNQKYMNIYYTLSQHNFTPSNPGNVGLSTLLMVLNALKIPHCVTLEGENSHIIGFDEFPCVARENGVSVDVIRVSEKSSLEDFRQTVKESTSSQHSVLVCMFKKDYECFGHFTIICGFCRDKDLILTRDMTSTAWLPLRVMWNLLLPEADSHEGTFNFTGGDRGYFLVRKTDDKKPVITLSINRKASIKLESVSLENTSEKLLELKNQWEQWLFASSTGTEKDILNESIQHVMDLIKNEHFKDKSEVPVSGEKTKLSYKQGSLVDSVTKTKVFPIVQSCMSSSTPEVILKMTQFAEWILDVLFQTRTVKPSRKRLSVKKKKKPLVKTCVDVNLFNNAAMLTTWLLFWPYDRLEDDEYKNTNCASLAEFIKADLEIFPKSVVQIFHQQIEFVLKALHHSARVSSTGST